MKTALITGASSGIGYELARIFARNHYRVILVARRRDKLREIQKELHDAYGVEIVIVPKDLSLSSAAEQVYGALEHEKIDVDVLVNNAGFGALGEFSVMDESRALEMINVNMTSLTMLTRLFLPHMLEKRHGRIMNVSSMAAFMPGPMMSVYYASKSYVLSFSEALAEELRGTGITVTALCPGITTSEFQQVAGITAMKQGWMVASSKEVAEYGYKALMKGKRVAVPGFLNKIGSFVARHSPHGPMMRMIRRMQGK